MRATLPVATLFRRRPVLAAAVVALAACLASSLSAQNQPGGQPQAVPQTAAPRQPDFERMLRQQAETDETWRTATAGYLQFEKTTYRTSVGDLDIPAFVFRPLKAGTPQSRPAIVWVHENIRGHLYEHYIPYIREAVARGYVVIAPEYRASIGYGQAFYD